MFTPTIHLDLRTQDVRTSFDVSLAPMDDQELIQLADIFALADKGQSVQIGTGKTEDGRQCLQFVVGKGASDGTV